MSLMHHYDPEHKMFQGACLGMGRVPVLGLGLSGVRCFGLFEPPPGELLVFFTGPMASGYLLRQTAGSVLQPLLG